MARIINTINDPIANQSASSVIAGVLARSQRLGDARTVIRGISSAYWRDVALRDLVIQLARFSIIPDMLSYIEEIQDTWMSREAKSYVCLYLAKAGYSQPASEMLREKREFSEAQQDDLTRSNKRTLAARLLADHEYFEAALQIANEVPGLAQRASSLVRIAFALATVGKEKEAEGLCKRILSFDFQRTPDSFSVEPLAFLGVMFHMLEKPTESAAAFELAKRIATSLEPMYGRCHACAELAKLLTVAGRIEEAYQMADEDNSCRDEINIAMIRSMDLTSHLELAKQRAYSIKTDTRYDKVWIFCFLAEAALENGCFEEANNIYSEIEHEIEKSHLYADNSRGYLAQSYAKVKRVEEADSVAQQITRQIDRARTQARIAAEVFMNGNQFDGRRRFVEAQRIADQVESFGQWEPALNNWASTLAAVGKVAEAMAIHKRMYGDDIPHLIEAWHDLIEQMEAGLALKALRDSSRILGWSDQGWDRIYHVMEKVVTD